MVSKLQVTKLLFFREELIEEEQWSRRPGRPSLGPRVKRCSGNSSSSDEESELEQVKSKYSRKPLKIINTLFLWYRFRLLCRLQRDRNQIVNVEVQVQRLQGMRYFLFLVILFYLVKMCLFILIIVNSNFGFIFRVLHLSTWFNFFTAKSTQTQPYVMEVESTYKN